MTLPGNWNSLRTGDSEDRAMTKGEYDALRDSELRPLPDPVTRLVEAIRNAPDEGWRERAACHPDNRDRPHDEWVGVWFPENGDNYREARTICAACPARAECRESGRDELFGMWGGDDAETRTRERSGGLPPMTRHGYSFGAQAHRRRGEQPCDECAAVQRAYEVAYRAKRKAAA
jgi:hypothetical protein